MSQTLPRITSLSSACLATPSLAPATTTSSSHELAAIAAEAGIRRVHFLAWRDLDDPEAGGSELHAHMVASHWAAAGIEVTFRTSEVPGASQAITRNGYQVLRRAGRYGVFPGAAWEGIRMGHRPGDALVEIWNGMPFLSPLWYHGPRLVLLHHVHAEMWGMVLPPALARAGEHRGAAPGPAHLPNEPRRHALGVLAHRDRTTCSGCAGTTSPWRRPASTTRYTPGGPALQPAAGGGGGSVGAGQAFRHLASRPSPGEGFGARATGGHHRRRLRAVRLSRRSAPSSARMTGCTLPGRVGDDELVSWYRRAWVVASTSQREGWGMTLTEAAVAVRQQLPPPSPDTLTPCSTASRASWSTAAHPNRVGDFAEALTRVLTDDVLRDCLSKGALVRAGWFTWDATARRALEALASETTWHG